MKHTDPTRAFETAISRGILDPDPRAENYAGRYMYMGDNDDGAHLFKHTGTRAYLPPVAPSTDSRTTGV